MRSTRPALREETATDTAWDPYGVTNATRFDELMNGFPPNTTVHLAAGDYQTKGYAIGVSGGWKPKRGFRIVGAQPHGFSAGQVVTVSGATGGGSPSPYNGTFQIATVPTPTSFTYPTSTDPGVNASGSPVCNAGQHPRHHCGRESDLSGLPMADLHLQSADTGIVERNILAIKPAQPLFYELCRLIKMFGNNTHDGKALQSYSASELPGAPPKQFKNDLITDAGLVSLLSF